MSIAITRNDGGSETMNAAAAVKPEEQPKLQTPAASAQISPASVPDASSAPTKLEQSGIQANQLKADLNAKIENSKTTAPVKQSAAPATDGANYSKYVSTPSTTDLGVSSKNITAPNVVTDPNRFAVYDANGKRTTTMSLENMNFHKTGPLDRPSIYMGTGGRQEVDAGVSWNRVYSSVDLDKNGKNDPTWTTSPNGSSATDQYVITRQNGQYSVFDTSKDKEVATSKQFNPNGDGSVKIGDLTLRPNFAFRAFSRVDGGSGTPDSFKNPEPGSKTDVYVYPKDKFSMSFTVSGSKMNLSVNGNQILSDDVPKFGQSKAPYTFKIVDSIDQQISATKPTESSKTDATKASVSGGSWGVTQIIGKNSQTPLNTNNSTAYRPKEYTQTRHDLMNSANGKGRIINQDGSREIYINPSKVK